MDNKINALCLGTNQPPATIGLVDTRDGSNRIYGKMTYGIYTYIRIYTYILVYIHILYGSMKKKEVSEQEDVVLMVNAERGLSKSSPISKRTVNDILVEEFVLPNVIFEPD